MAWKADTATRQLSKRPNADGRDEFLIQSFGLPERLTFPRQT